MQYEYNQHVNNGDHERRHPKNTPGSSSMKWFRFYSEVIHDPKIQTLPVGTRWAWVSILCLANEGNPRGVLPPLRDIAFALRLQVTKATSVVDELIAAGLIDRMPNGSLIPHNWDARQHRSDDVAERVRRHRDKAKTMGNVTSNVTLHETANNTESIGVCNVTGNVTGNEHVRSSARAESETESETESPLTPRGETSDDDFEPELDGPIGVNSASQVREALFVARELFEGTSIPVVCRQWLKDHAAARVIAAVSAAKDNGASVPAKYIEKLLVDPKFPKKAKAAAPRREPPAPTLPIAQHDPNSRWAKTDARNFPPKLPEGDPE